jgi:o-succinylbenzoate synthase
MKITSIEVFPIAIPLKQPFKTSKAQQTMGNFVIVKVHTDEGIIGLGEGDPRPHMTGETLETTTYVLKKYICPHLIGENPLDIAKIHNIMDRLIELNPSAKCAIDIAIYDLIAKKCNMPLYALLGGAIRRDLYFNAFCDLAEIKETIQVIKEQIKEGARSVKIKVGSDPLRDFQKVRELRKEIGPEFDLIVDANQAWDVYEAINAIRNMEKYVTVVEQPIFWKDLEGMAKISKMFKVHIMADESVWFVHDAKKVARIGAATMINIKFTKSGGIYEAKKIATVSSLYGIKCMVGTTTETSIMTSARAHFAASTENVKYLDADTRTYLYEDVAYGLKMEGKKVLLEDKPGLGIEVDDKILKKYIVRNLV